MKKGNNIILIGMPGAGKSTIGVILAKVKGYNFVDTDLVIQEKEGRLLHDIIASEGTDGFIKIEEEVNASIVCDKTVIAPGGSVIYGPKAMEHFKEIGTIVYLKISLKVLKKRLGDLERRGVVLKDGQTLTDLYNERVPLFEKYADITVDEEDCNVEETVKCILNVLKQR
ncbi:shikimate kinase [Lachnobacterium bovis]|uniref:Shikimate kinase n=1 Tax=Lachnobacterium bovis TaxID=140626 RepID=A0A1H9SPX0_9FIRM|nr:shikimate kinase [Lachnobacterium bovis]SER86981.1 shikimate kinase [Lachnobacterium bovis]